MLSLCKQEACVCSQKGNKMSVKEWIQAFMIKSVCIWDNVYLHTHVCYIGV